MCYEVGAGLGIPVIFPSAGSIIRHPFPSTGSPGAGSPLLRYHGVLPLLTAPPAALRFLRLAVPCVRSAFAPGEGERSAPGPGLFDRVPVPALSHGDDQVSQVPGEPPCVHAPLFDPGELFTPGFLRRVDTAFRLPNDVGARG